MKIGDRVRQQQRKTLGCSLRELGTRTDLTASFLSQLENDQISPSLNSLQSMTTALQVPMSYLLNGTRPNSVVRAHERRKPYCPDSPIGYDVPAPEITRHMMPLLIRMKPGTWRIAQPSGQRFFTRPT